jgi:hypothetical protein
MSGPGPGWRGDRRQGKSWKGKKGEREEGREEGRKGKRDGNEGESWCCRVDAQCVGDDGRDPIHRLYRIVTCFSFAASFSLLRSLFLSLGVRCIDPHFSRRKIQWGLLMVLDDESKANSRTSRNIRRLTQPMHSLLAGGHVSAQMMIEFTMIDRVLPSEKWVVTLRELTDLPEPSATWKPRQQSVIRCRSAVWQSAIPSLAFSPEVMKRGCPGISQPGKKPLPSSDIPSPGQLHNAIASRIP